MIPAMDADEVNRVITDEVDNISDRKQKQFVREILKFERGNLDKDKYEYKQTYKDLIKQYTQEEEAN